MRRLLYTVLITAAVLMNTSCKSDDNQFVHVEKVTIDVRDLHLNPGQEHQLSVGIEPLIATNKRVTWYSSNTSIAVVDQHGRVYALTTGNVKITAESNDMHINDVIPLVIDNLDNSVPIESLALNIGTHDFNISTDPTATTLQLTPTILPVGATNKNLAWTSDDPIVATVDVNGLVTAVSQGKTNIMASSTDGGAKTDVCQITVIGVKDRGYDMTGDNYNDEYYKVIYYPVNMTVIGEDGKSMEQTWLDRNLGAKSIATTFDDHTGYGSLFQWSRKADGHEKTNWTAATTGTLVNTAAVANSRSNNRRDAGSNAFIPTSADPHDWAAEEASNRDGLWGGRFADHTYLAPINAATQDNNPCPSGYRLPTIDEFIRMSRVVTSNSAFGYGTFTIQDVHLMYANSVLKLPQSGQVVFNGSNAAQAGRGVYWTNMAIVEGANGIFSNAARFILLKDLNQVRLDHYQRTNAYSVRCIRHTPLDKESAAMR